MIVQIVGFVLVMIVWSFVKIQSFLSKQQTKEAALFGGLIGISSIIGSLLIAHVDISSPIVPQQIIFEHIGKMLLKR